MKIFIKTIIIIIIILDSSCKKDKSENDYRDSYVGIYDFQIIYSHPSSALIDGYNVMIWKDSNYKYTGTISKSQILNKIIVDWGKDTILTSNNIIFTQKSNLTIDSIGILTYPEYGGFGHTFFYPPAYIKYDTIKFNICSGGLGYYSCWTVNGLKKK